MGSGGITPPLLILALDEGEWSAVCPGLFMPEKLAPDAHLIEGWVGSRASLDTAEKIKNLSLLPEIESWLFSL
jgi:hypothetical protein